MVSVATAWYIDIHNPAGKGGVNLSDIEEGGWNDVPYRSLYSAKVENLLTAGRCISTTHEAQAAVRIMPTCIATGQAAGTAAAMMCSMGIGNVQVNTDKLRELLAADGAYITGLTLR